MTISSQGQWPLFSSGGSYLCVIFFPLDGCSLDSEVAALLLMTSVVFQHIEDSTSLGALDDPCELRTSEMKQAVPQVLFAILTA